MTTTQTAHTTSSSTRRTRARARALGVLGAVLAALAVWIVADPLLGADLLVRPGGGSPQSVGAGPVVAASLLAALLGWALLAILERRTSRARGVWTGIALVVLVLSLSGPLTGGTTLTTKATLAIMHLAVAAVLIQTLRRSSPTA
jgi:hypothetical protein